MVHTENIPPVPAVRKESVQRRSDPKESYLVIIGDRGAGKSTVIQILLDRDNAPTKPTLALDYTYGRKQGRLSLAKDVCHLWEVAGGTQSQLLPSVLSTTLGHLAATTCVIVLDLSRPGQPFSRLLADLSLLQKCLEEATSKAEKSDQSLRQALADKARARVGGEEHPDWGQLTPLPLPLVVVGAKYDSFQDQEPAVKRVICRALRFTCHRVGASLVFYSHKDGGLVKKLKETLTPHCFGGSTEGASLSQDYNRPLLIPPGGDSFAAISGGLDGSPPMTEEGWKQAIASKISEEAAGEAGEDFHGMPPDPSADPMFAEPDIDNLRRQKDQELERLSREGRRVELDWEV